MRPIKITVCGYGSYAGTETVDFTRFNGNVFLISGKTGAGKSTLFHAMSFALYGEDDGKARSQYADPTQPTYVEFLFEHGDKTYVIRRTPAYQKKKLRGEGFTEQKSTQEFLCKETGKVFTKANEVAAAIEETIGLSKEQFYQTVMIRQGEFRRVLTAKSDERTELLRKLFGTGFYERFQKIAKNAENEAQSSFLTEKANLSRIKDEINRVSEGALAHLTEYGKEEALTDTLVEYEKKLSEDLRDLNEGAEPIEKNIRTLKILQNNAKRVNEDLTALAKDAKDAYNLYRCKADYNAFYGQLTAARRAKSADVAYFERQSAIRLLCESEQNLQTNSKNLEEINAAARLIDADYSLIPAKKQALDQTKNALRDLNDCVAVYQEYSSQILKKQDAEQELLRALGDRNRKDTAYMAIYSRYMNCQAGILANALRDGCPCPVCGSVHHPAPARSNESLHEKDVEKAKKEYERANEVAVKAENALQFCKRTLDGSADKLRLLGWNGTDGKEVLLKKASAVRAEIERTEGWIRETEEKKRKSDSDRDGIRGAIGEIERNLPTLRRVADEKRACFSVALRECGFASEEEYLSARRSDAEVQNLQERVNGYTAAIRNAVLSIPRLRESLKRELGEDPFPEWDLLTVHEELGFEQLIALGEAPDLMECSRRISAKRINVSQYGLQIDALEVQKRELQKKTQSLHTAIERLKEAKRQLARSCGRISELSRAYTVAKSVSDTYRGTLTGSKRISIEAYVQQYYFKEVLSAANLRLQRLTDGAFWFSIREESGGRGKTGLDIDVYDANTNDWRSVETLSGGESFMASLSLALGLSDVVQRQSGNVRIEAMFIDEGFGSLDEDSLRLAIDTINRLSADGGSHRLVGVISHVEELERRIEKKILVKKGKQGSTLSFVL